MIKSMKRLQPILGILLILLAIASLYFWETVGREAVFMEPVLIASQDIPWGIPVTKDMLTETVILKENKIKGGLSPSQAVKIYGKIADQPILKNDQISERRFNKREFRLEEGQSIFVLKPQWIDMCSSSLRRGDRVEVFMKGEERQSLGTYQIAFVKDSSVREVQSVTAEGSSVITSDLLSRKDASAPVQTVEIICNMEEYEKLAGVAESVEEPSLVIVQREEHQ